MIQFADGRWEGLDGMGEEAMREIRPEAERVVLQASLVLEGTIKRTLTGKRSGRTYKVSRTGRLHVASAPGEAPAVQFGDLRRSVGHSDPEWEGWTVGCEVGPGLGQAPGAGRADPGEGYARRLEWGGTDSRGTYIAPRPYMEPSAQKAEQPMDVIFRSLGN